jgi:cyanophycinase
MAKEKADCPVPEGILLVIGGKENKGESKPNEREKPDDFIKQEILKAFVDLITVQEPTIEVITTASSEGAESFREYKKIFKALGLNNVNQIHHDSRKEALEDESLVEKVKEGHGFFLTGGDQLKLTSIYGGTPFLRALKEKYIHKKIVVAGTSAGAMALSTPMIYSGSKSEQEIGGEIKVTTGLEFLKDVCIDTHFVHRGRFVRMAQVIVTNPTCVGIGIEEDTAIIVRKGNEAEVVGSGTIIVLDGFYIKDSNIVDFSEKKPVTIKDLKMHILGSGEKYIIPQLNPPHW